MSTQVSTLKEAMARKKQREGEKWSGMKHFKGQGKGQI